MAILPRCRHMYLYAHTHKQVAGGPLLSLEGLSLINLKIPDTALTAWVQGLASNRASLQVCMYVPVAMLLRRARVLE